MRQVWAHDRVVDPHNVWQAWLDFRRGKRRRPEVAAFGVRAEAEVLTLARELAAGAWRPSGYTLLRITDPKRRIVAKAPVRDRVVHHAIHRVVAPVLDRRLIHHTYACLPGRGTQRALLACQRQLRRCRYVLHLDVSRYFYTIDRRRLKALLFSWLPEPRLQALVDRVLDSGAGLYQRPAVARWLGWQAPPAQGCGLPIGNLTSQWWANLYLDRLDHYVTRTLRPRAYQRYMDDLVLFGDDPAALLAWRAEIARWALAERGLRLKDPDAQPRSTYRPMLYLGHRVTREEIRLGPKARERLPGRLSAHATAPARAAAAVQAYGALWMWGV